MANVSLILQELTKALADLRQMVTETTAQNSDDTRLASLLERIGLLEHRIATGGGDYVGQDETIHGDRVGRDKVGRDQHLQHLTVVVPSHDESGQGRNIAVRWSERNSEAVRYFLTNCDECPDDEDRLLEYLERHFLVHRSRDGTVFTEAGALLFGPSDMLPPDMHTDVLIDDRRFDPPESKSLNGLCIMDLLRNLISRVEIWADEWEDPYVRDNRGRPAKIATYPRAALVEAAVNFVIHRDFKDNDLGFISITNSKIEFVNPGTSFYTAERLLTTSSSLRPKYDRNQKIIETISRTRLNQRQGEGILRIRRLLEDNDNVAPDGTLGLDIRIDHEQNRFTLVLYARKRPQPIPAEALTPRAPDLSKITEDYLSGIRDRHEMTSLKGMGVSDRVPLRLPLLDLYVPLKARLELPEGETWRRLQLAGRVLQPDDPELLASRLGEPQPLLDLLQRHDGLVILGDPGAGKTTFLKYLALQLALGQADAVGLGSRLPVLAPLSAYANALRERDVRLDDFIAAYMHDLGSDLPMADLMQQALRQGAGLVLLDGLDEVADARLRHTVVERVVDFYTFHRRAGNKFVLTSRIVGYRAVRPVAAGLVECTLVDFEDEEIAEFVGRWTQALEAQASGQSSALAAADAARERTELLDAVQRNPGVRRLAANPLLLTILALMKRQGVTLPERRVELYDQYVRTLLSTWNRARGLAGRAPERELDPVQTMKVLAPLALWMHEVNPGVGLVKREALRRQLEAILEARGVEQAEEAATRFLEDVREYAGLLVERGAGEYGFIHLTFEEYLAGAGIALLGQRTEEPIVEAIAQHIGDPAWREVALLAIGYLAIVQQREEAAGAVVEALVAEQPGPPGEAVVLAGEAVLDAGAGGLPVASKERVVAALIATMQAGSVPAVVRRRAGLALGRLGWVPEDMDEFVAVPAGEFLYGERKERRHIRHAYWIAKYPVTNAQFARFMADGGYARREWWSDEGWSWRIGTYDSRAPDWLEGWLKQRPPEKRDQPFWWDDLEFANPVFPVVGVSWFEVEAYANWLSGVLDALPVTGQGPLPKPAGYAVRLAEEVEWERAARGVDGRDFPWGDALCLECVNTLESNRKGGLGGTTAVCTYPQGVSPAGAWDMSGNVWEWTQSLYSEEQALRVVRGGSWGSQPHDARCAVRSRHDPSAMLSFVGLRIVCAPLLS